MHNLAAPHGSPLTHNHDTDVLAVDACLRDAIRLKDVGVALSLMTEDVVLVGPAGPPIAGRDAVRDALFVSPRWKQDVEEIVNGVSVEVLGETAIIVRDSSVTATATFGLGALPSVRLTGRTISVFRHQLDGWKLARSLSLMRKTLEQS